jgi:hypothetical protein
MADLSAIAVAVVELDGQRNDPYEKRNDGKQVHNFLLLLPPVLDFLKFTINSSRKRPVQDCAHDMKAARHILGPFPWVAESEALSR